MGKKAIRTTESEAALALLETGLTFPGKPKRDVERGSRLGRDVDDIRASWAQGNTSPWPETSWPGAPLSMPELGSHCDAVDFALRRAVDGIRPSRPTAVDALRLSGRLELMNRVFHTHLDRLNTRKWRRALADLALLRFRHSRSLILYLQTHACPDLTAADDPSAWMDRDHTNAVRLRMIDHVAAAHRTLEEWFPTSGRQETHAYLRAELFAFRVMAHVTVDSIAGVDTRQRTGLTQESLIEGKALIATLLAHFGRERNYSARIPCLLAEAILTFEWEGDRPGFRRRIYELADDAALRPYERLNLLRTTLHLGNTNPDETMAIVSHSLDIADAAPPSVREHLLSSFSPYFVEVLAEVCQDRPEEASSMSGRLSGFGSSRHGSRNRPHVWLLGTDRFMALIDRSDSIETIALPALGQGGSIEKLVNLHAEEHQRIHDLGRLRKELTEQMKPLTRRLATLETPITYFGFGHLKYIPIAALTGSGAILASAPSVRVLARRRHWETPPGGCEVNRRFVIDESIQQSRNLHNAQGIMTSFDSNALTNDGSVGLRCMESLAEPARQIVFFGHGFVDQFRSDHFGLVTRRDPCRDGAYFLPARAFAQRDLRQTEFALIMACGAGQAGVFSSSQLSVADAFCLAGCQLVIAPLWPIEASAAADFTMKFLTAVDNGAGPQDAWAKLLSQDPNRFCSIALFSD